MTLHSGGRNRKRLLTKNRKQEENKMKKRSSRAIALLLAVVMVLALAACGEEPAVDPAESGEPEPSGETPAASGSSLVVALPGEPQSLDPYAHSMYYNFMAATLIFDTLVTKDADGNYVPELATEWEFTDDLTLHVVLRDDVYFHDGSQLTADDVKFTLDTAAASSFSSN